MDHHPIPAPAHRDLEQVIDHIYSCGHCWPFCLAAPALRCWHGRSFLTFVTTGAIRACDKSEPSDGTFRRAAFLHRNTMPNPPRTLDSASQIWQNRTDLVKQEQAAASAASDAKTARLKALRLEKEAQDAEAARMAAADAPPPLAKKRARRSG
jgi:hypothetical protein